MLGWGVSSDGLNANQYARCCLRGRRRPPPRPIHCPHAAAHCFAHAEKDSVYYTLCTSTELFLRNDGQALLVIGVDKQLTDEHDVAKLRAAGAELSSRRNLTVILEQAVSGLERRRVLYAGRVVSRICIARWARAPRSAVGTRGKTRCSRLTS